MSAQSEKIFVAVRLRPVSAREQGIESSQSVTFDGQKCTVNYLRDGAVQTREFFFDGCYDSSDPSLDRKKDQERIYNEIGKTVLMGAAEGYNGCILAYGQTGSGKSYSMLGGPGAVGIIPRLSQDLFTNLVNEEGSAYEESRVWVSFLEDYNEQLHDLLAHDVTGSKKGSKDNLQIVEHPKFGSVVLGLTESPVRSMEEFQRLLDYGTQRRMVASTNMNAVSSRSHAVYTIRIQRIPKEGSSLAQVEARVNLVDLAGSERIKKTNSSGQRMKEGAAINKSLTILAQVIKELSEINGPLGANRFIPFRSSKLTFLLKNSLCGNSRTRLIAGISPSTSEGEETVSTLRFAQSVKKVTTVAVANKTQAAETLASLKREIEELKKQLEHSPSDEGVEALQVVQHMVTYNEDYDKQLDQATEEMRKRMQFLEQMGIHVPNSAVYENVTKNTPYLLNVSQDVSMSGSLMWPLPKGRVTTVGSSQDCDIVVGGLGMLPKMCTIENSDDKNVTVRLTDEGGKVLVQGKQVAAGGTPLQHLNHILFGRALIARVQIPQSASWFSNEKPETFEQILESLGMSEDSQAWQDIQWHLQELANTKLSQNSPVFKAILSALKVLCPLVDEANEISAELWPIKTYRFRIMPLFNAKDICDDDIEFKASADSFLVEEMRREGPEEKFQQKSLLSSDNFQARVAEMRSVFDRFHGLSYSQIAAECGLARSRGPLDIKLDQQEDPWADPGVTIENLRADVKKANDEAMKARKVLARQLETQPEYIKADKIFQLLHEPTTLRALLCCGGRPYHINKRMMEEADLDD